MEPRMSNPAAVLPGAMQAVLNLFKATKQGGVAETTMELVHLRVSQINGCSACVDSGAKQARKAGETDERLFDGRGVAGGAVLHRRRAGRAGRSRSRPPGWPTAPTAVPDEIWDAAAKHYDEPGLASLLLMIATTNLFNRLNATTRQVAGAWG